MFKIPHTHTSMEEIVIWPLISEVSDHGQLAPTHEYSWQKGMMEQSCSFLGNWEAQHWKTVPTRDVSSKSKSPVCCFQLGPTQNRTFNNKYQCITPGISVASPHPNHLSSNLLVIFKINRHIITIMSFCSLIALATILTIVLGWSGKSRHSCLILDFKGDTFSFYIFNMKSLHIIFYTATMVQLKKLELICIIRSFHAHIQDTGNNQNLSYY